MKWDDEVKIKAWEISLMWVIIWINLILVIITTFGLRYVLNNI